MSGYIALVSVIVVGAVGVAIVVSLLLLGLGSMRTSFADAQGGIARSYANSCAEEALQKINENTSFTGTSSISFSSGTCNYSVQNTGGSNRNVEVTGTVGTIVRKVKITINAVSPLIGISSWQEVGSF